MVEAPRSGGARPGWAAGGVLVVRNERQRKSYSAEEIRERLQQRLNEAAPEE